MTKLVFSKKRFNAESKAVLDQIIPIVQDYQEQGYKMSLRQLYYQLVSKVIIYPITKRNIVVSPDY